MENGIFTVPVLSKRRAAEFNELLYRDDVQILMASVGGNNTNPILPYIDYEYVKGHP